MMYGIFEIQEAYSLWKHANIEKDEKFALSFSYGERKEPLIFAGLSSIREHLGTKIFTKDEIGYLHSLQKGNGQLLFADKFISLLSLLTFDIDIETPLEGAIFFRGQPVVKVIGNMVVLVFFKKILSYYLPRQIQIATEVERIASYISPAYVVSKNARGSYERNGALDSRSAYIGGAIASEDLSAAVAYKIPICFHDDSSDLILLDIAEKQFAKKVAFLQKEDKIFLNGSVTKGFLEDYPYLISHLKGVSVDLANLSDEVITIRYHHYRTSDVLDDEFKVYRFSYKGLFIGDILTSDYSTFHRKTLFGKSLSLLTKVELLHHVTLEEQEDLGKKRARSVKGMRLLPCKYRSSYTEQCYPVRILRKAKVQENEGSFSKTQLA